MKRWIKGLLVGITTMLLLATAVHAKERPGFKQFKLGMTRSQVQHVLNTTSWDHYRYGSYKMCDPRDKVDVSCFKGERSDMLLGSTKGPHGREFWAKAIYVTYFEGRIYRIRVSGNVGWSADYIDSWVKDSGKLMRDAITKRHGPPFKTQHSIERDNIFDFGSDDFNCYWILGYDLVGIVARSSDFHYYYEIIYRDEKAKKKVDAIEADTKPAF